jgi:hypothetical protein
VRLAGHMARMVVAFGAGITRRMHVLGAHADFEEVLRLLESEAFKRTPMRSLAGFVR